MDEYRSNGSYDYKDFNRLYKVRVPITATYTEDELEAFGLYDNYDAKGKSFVLDIKKPEKTLEIKVEPYLSIYRIIDVASQGYSVVLLESKERLQELYAIVDAYLGYCESLTTLTLHKVEIGDNGLYDKAAIFIKEVYGINRKTIERGLIDTTASGFNLDMGLIGNTITVAKNDEYEGLKFNMPDPNNWRA